MEKIPIKSGNPWVKFPDIQGIGGGRLRKLEIVLSDLYPEYSTLILQKGTILSTGKIEKTTLYIRKKDK